MNSIKLNDFINYFFKTTNLEELNVKLFLFSSKYYAKIKTQGEFVNLITSNVVYNDVIMFNVHKFNRKIYITFHLSDNYELCGISTAKSF